MYLDERHRSDVGVTDRSDGGVTRATSDEMTSQANDDDDGLSPENGAARPTLRITLALLVAAFVSLLSS